jgi:ubiquinone/menaquinone biosynthesis C-methylase UbiE
MSLYRKLKEVYDCYKHPGRTTSITYKKYPKECNFNGRKVLNVGCGTTFYPAKNVINLDKFNVPGVNVVFDLSKTPLPFKDEEFDFVIANHILEHVPNWWECFKELARVVKYDGQIEVWGPGHGESQLGYRDHINIINHCSFSGIRNTKRNGANAWELEDRKTLGHVQELALKWNYKALERRWWLAILPRCFQQWMADYIPNVVTEVGWNFVKMRDENEPI